MLACIKQHLEAREPYYLQADYVVDAPVGDSISEEDDEHLAQLLYELIIG